MDATNAVIVVKTEPETYSKLRWFLFDWLDKVPVKISLHFLLPLLAIIIIWTL